MIRILSAVVGLLIVAATAYYNIQSAHTGAQGLDLLSQPIAIVSIVCALGSAVGGIVITSAWQRRMFFMAAGIFVCLVAGEGFGLLNTADRVVTNQEATQAPLRDQAQRHKEAVAKVAAATAALRSADASAAVTTPRLEAAKAAVDEANEAVRSQASLPGCRINCNQLLQKQVDTARREMEEAETAAEGDRNAARKRLEDDLAEAKRFLAANPMPASATPFADRTGVEPWKVDITKGILLSLAMNGLGTLFIAFAAHGGPREREPRREMKAIVEVETIEPVKPRKVAQPQRALAKPDAPTGSVTKFMAASLDASEGEKIEIADLYLAYRAWCVENDTLPADISSFGDDVSAALDFVGIARKVARGKVYLLDVAIPQNPSRQLTLN